MKQKHKFKITSSPFDYSNFYCEKKRIIILDISLVFHCPRFWLLGIEYPCYGSFAHLSNSSRESMINVLRNGIISSARPILNINKKLDAQKLLTGYLSLDKQIKRVVNKK